MHDHPHPASARALRLGVAGPVGTGKTSLIALLCRSLGDEFRIAVVTNDIYTDEDARLLRSMAVLPDERIRAVGTGACPHTAIRDDISMNLLAVEDLEEQFTPLDMVLIESGGDNLTATFSPGLVDALSRTVPESVDRLADWVRQLRADHIAGTHLPVDPGPVAPHRH